MRSTQEIEVEIRDRLGSVPAFLKQAEHAPAMLHSLWQQTCTAYLDNPLPGVFKERVIAYLSHCCGVSYCTVQHSCVLGAGGTSADEILALLGHPDPRDAGVLAQAQGVLTAAEGPLASWPAPGTALERALLTAAAALFLDRAGAPVQGVVMHLLGPERHACWLVLLGYVKAYHQWVNGCPGLSARDDERVQAVLPRLLQEQPRLAALLADAGGGAGPRARAREDAPAGVDPAAAAIGQPEGESLQRLLDSAPVGCIQVDTRGTIRFVNAQVSELFGYALGELIGESVDLLLPSRFQGRHPALRAAFFADPAVRKMGAGRRVYGRKKDGTEVPLEIGLAPYRAGDLRGAIATVVDISARDRAEETLRRVSDARERLNRLFLAGAGDMYADVLDLVLEIFDSEFGLFGYIDEQGSLVCPSMTRHVWDVCDIAGKAIVFPERTWGGLWGRVLREKRCLIKNDVHVVPEGHLPLYRSMGAPLLYRGELIGALHVANRGWDYDDIDRKVMEALADQVAPLLAAYRAEEELRRSNSELESFAYVASHDLQEPLRMVASYTELLAHRYRGQIDDRADKYIQYAVDGVMRMQKLIHDILAVARAGRDDAVFERVECGRILDEVLQELDLSIRQCGAVITRDPLPVLSVDAAQLAQVFRNLLGNALKFRGAAPPRIHVSAHRSGSDWRFGVADNGIGIEAEHGHKVFLWFQRLHDRGRYPGSGIGLALAKKIVERHRGRIWFESRPGQGTTFFFTLPAEMS